jgi:hypothetical protein
LGWWWARKADSYGYRPTMVLCLLAVAMSSLATGLSTMLSVLVLAALLGAVGRAAIMPVAQAVATAVFLDDSARRRAVSRIQNGGPLADTDLTARNQYSVKPCISTKTWFRLGCLIWRCGTAGLRCYRQATI